MFKTVGSSGVPAGKSSGSRGSCKLQGNVLPLVAVGVQTPATGAAIGTAVGSLTPVFVECKCLNTLIRTSGSKSLMATISAPGSDPRSVRVLQVTVFTSVYPLLKLLVASIAML